MDNTKLFEDIIANAKIDRLCEAREDTIGDFGDLCAEALGIKKVGHFTKRNEHTLLASYNKKDDTVYYHTDLLWLPVDLVKSIIAHEIAHAAAGLENEHNEVWMSYYQELKDAFPKDNIRIFKEIDELDRDKGIFKNLVPGKLMSKFYEKYPEIKGHVTIGLNIPNKMVKISREDNTKLIVRPTFYCTDVYSVAGYNYITKELIQKADINIKCVSNILLLDQNDEDRDIKSLILILWNQFAEKANLDRRIINIPIKFEDISSLELNAAATADLELVGKDIKVGITIDPDSLSFKRDILVGVLIHEMAHVVVIYKLWDKYINNKISFDILKEKLNENKKHFEIWKKEAISISEKNGISPEYAVITHIDFMDDNLYEESSIIRKDSLHIIEADKSRFLKPIYDKYSNDYAGIPEYESLLKFVNNDPFMSGFDWQQMFKSFRDGDDETAKSYFDSIINKYQRRWDERERKTSEKLALHNGNIAEMARAKGFKVVEGEDSSDADFAVLSSLETDKFSFIVPLNWKAAQFCDSFDCGGEGAKWCIGMKNNNAYWDEYTQQGNLFILAFNKDVAKKSLDQRDENILKYMIQISAIPDETQAWTQDDNHSNVIRMENFKEFFGRSVVSMVEAFANSILCDDTAFNNGRYYFTEEDDITQASIPWTDEELEGGY